MFSILFLVIIAVVVITAAVMKAQAEERRRSALFLLSNTLNLTYYGEDILGVAQTYGSFDLLSIGDSRRAYDVMAGQFEGLNLAMFDYQYSTGSGKSRETHHLSVTAMDTDMSFIGLFIRPENVLDRVAAAVGFEDIDFESDEFSRAFYVRSQDKKFAYDVIHPKMMEFLLANRGWCLQMLGPSVLVYQERLLSADEFLHAAEFVGEFIRLLPDYLVQTLRTQPTQ